MIGRTVGNYVISAKVGQGGMGVVYRAEHPQISRAVAIKVLHPGADRNPELVHRFFNEARAATQIRNEHVVEVLDFGELPEHMPYLVMEWLEGQSLGTLLLAETKLSVARASHVLRGIVRALKAAHAKGVVHRDLKPDNVYLVPREGDSDLVKVLDFGIAKLMAAAGPSQSYQTQTGAIIGTPAYMSPEQCRGAKEIDARTDIYSLGVIGYQMLTGCLPFGAAAIGELLFKQLTERPPALAALEPSLPAPLCSIIAQALEKEPDGRPTLAQLSAVLESTSATAVPPEPGRAATGAAAAGGTMLASSPASFTTLGGSAAPVEPPRRSGRSRRAKLIAASVLAAAAGAAAIVALTRKAPEPAAAPTTSSGVVLPSVAKIAAPAAPAPVVPAQPVPAQPVRVQPGPSAAPEAPATVRIAIRTEPAGAHLEVDGRSANPFVGTLSPDGRPHVVSASSPGFKMVRQSIVFDRDRDLVLTLVPASASAAPARPRAGPRNAASESAGASAEKEGPGPAGYRGSKLKIETEFPGP